MATLHDLAQDFLAQKTIAVVGVSDKRETGCNLNYRKFKAGGHKVYAVNPHLTTYDGAPCYPDLKSLPERPDAVFILAKPSVTDAMVQQCVELGITRVWMHCMMGTKPGLAAKMTSVSAPAVETCRANGITVIPGSCPAQFLQPDPGHRFMRGLWGLLGFMRVPAIILAAALASLTLSAATARAQCAITDEREYAVLAAVLFPNKPDLPETRPISLSGFHGSRYTISTLSLSRKVTAAPNADVIDDFNAKNAQTCTWNATRFVAPPGTSVTWLSEEDARKRQPGAEITRVSRPGFSKAGTDAIIEVDLQAGPEMGVGYRVRLQKSPKTAAWIITGADQIRIY